MTFNVYKVEDEKVTFGCEGERKRTAKMQYDEGGDAFFKGFGGMKLFFRDIISNASAWGDKTALAAGIIGTGNI